MSHGSTDNGFHILEARCHNVLAKTLHLKLRLLATVGIIKNGVLNLCIPHLDSMPEVPYIGSKRVEAILLIVIADSYYSDTGDYCNGLLAIILSLV